MSIPNKTYKNLVDTLKALGTHHRQIHTTTVGDIFDISLEDETLYPLMHINPISVTTGRVGLTYNFQIFIMDVVYPTGKYTDLTNEQDVYNDVLQTCVDVISIFRNSKWQSQLALDIDAPVYFAEGDFTLEPFTERFDNAVSGWVFQIGINVENDFQSCDIPMDNTYIGQ